MTLERLYTNSNFNQLTNEIGSSPLRRQSTTMIPSLKAITVDYLGKQKQKVQLKIKKR